MICSSVSAFRDTVHHYRRGVREHARTAVFLHECNVGLRRLDRMPTFGAAQRRSSRVNLPVIGVGRWLLALLLLGTLTAAAPMQGRGSWWDRTDPGPRRPPAKSRFYTIRSDLPVNQTKEYADLLDTMYREYMRLMQGLRKRGREHLDVFMFSTQQDYIDTLRTRFGANAAGSGGMFFIGPRGSGLAYFTDRLPPARVEHVIRHEGFHQIAHIFFDGDLPPWANEGLAEYFGEAVVVDGTVIEGQVTARSLAKVRELIERDRVIPFAELLSRDLKTWNGAVAAGGAEAQYTQSASMVQFLLWGEGGGLSDSFSTYLRNLNEGRDSLTAFRNAFGGTDDRALADFQRRWLAFVKDQKPGSFRAASERLQFMADGMLMLRERGIHPRTLDQLRDALTEAGFEQAVGGSHGGSAVLRAGDEEAFTIPVDHIQERHRKPAFKFIAKGSVKAKSKPGSKPESKPGSKPTKEEGGGTSGTDGTDEGSSETVGSAAKPPPLPELSTQDLRPRDLRISWSQDADGRWSAQLRLK